MLIAVSRKDRLMQCRVSASWHLTQPANTAVLVITVDRTERGAVVKAGFAVTTASADAL